MNPPEIKAEKRYRFPSDKVKQWDGSAVVVEVKAVDDHFVYLRDTKRLEGYVITVSYFLENYEPVPEPKTRHITADDIMKMLAVNPVVYIKPIGKEDWYQPDYPTLWLKRNQDRLTEYQFSHNPFAPNPVIVGPEIEVVE